MPRNEHFKKMHKKVAKGSKTSLPEELSSKNEVVSELGSNTSTGKENQIHDDSEHFEFEFLRIFKLKSKRVTKNVIIVITILALIGYFIAKG
jgi:hypothetical protein